jgi:metallo-beta-lactamase family protein
VKLIKEKKMEIKFIGAAQTVTGSRHMLTSNNGYKILLDCGLYQSKGSETDALNRHLGFDPAQIDCVILSHAHIDHSGNLPNLVKQGYRKKIFCTPATADLCKIMLADCAKIQENDTDFLNKKRIEEGRELIEPIYDQLDVERCLRLFHTLEYGKWFPLNEEISFMFTDAGHILGSACVHVQYKENGQTKQITYTGDIGNPNDLLLKSPEKFPQADYIICESTYGNRLHPAAEESESELLRIVTETCVKKQGKLLIPAFSLGRTQEIVYTLDRLKNKGHIPNLKVFVDSPLSTNATNIMRKYAHALNSGVAKHMETDEDPFGFNQLTYITDKEESIALNDLKGPCIIISASGMIEAGRIKHHLRNQIGKAENTLLIAGYCAPGTLGAKLVAGHPQVQIFGRPFDVKMKIETLESYSAHADYAQMIDFLACQEKEKVKEIFLVHGEPEPQLFFKIQLQDAGYNKVYIPAKKEVVTLN